MDVEDVLRLASSASVLVAVGSAMGADWKYNPLGRTAAYQRRRMANWLAVGWTYVCMYMARYAVVVINTEHVRAMLGVTRAGYGGVLLAGFWSYGVFQLINGHALDKAGGKTGLRLGAAGCALCCGTAGLVLYGLRTVGDVPPATMVCALGVFNVCNMACNTLASLSVVKVNSAWYSKTERGVFSGIFGIMISVGYYAALVVGGWIYAGLPFFCVFFAPALLLPTAFVLTGRVVADEPEADLKKLELVNAQTASNPIPSEGVVVEGGAAWGAASLAPPARSGWCQCFHKARFEFDPREFAKSFAILAVDRRVQCAAGGLFGVGWVREGFLGWFASYLEASSGVTQGGVSYTAAALAISVASMVGSLAGGYLSDACFHSKRGPVALMYCIAQICILATFGPATARGGLPVAIAYISALSGFLFGVLSLLMGAAAMDFADPKLTGTASGMINSAQYFGAGCGALATGFFVDAFGWSAFAPVLVVGSLISTGCMIALLKHDQIVKKEST